jgi:hypothetical protein
MMHRASLFAAVTMLVLSLVGGGVASAATGTIAPAHQGPVVQATSFHAHVTKGVQGKRLWIVAKVRHGDHHAAISAQAVVHFTSGDVSVDLHRLHHSRVLVGRVPVAADAALGPITVDVTFTYDGVVQPVIVLETRVIAPRH